QLPRGRGPAAVHRELPPAAGGVTAPVRDRLAHPPFREAVMADARVTCALRGDRYQFTSKRDAVLQALRLLLEADAYLAQVCYRAEVALRQRGIPLLPRLAHRLSVLAAQVDIGPDVVVAPGLYLAHGQLTIRGHVDVDRMVVFFPWVEVEGGR